jgi:hypothetical protein
MKGDRRSKSSRGYSGVIGGIYWVVDRPGFEPGTSAVRGHKHMIVSYSSHMNGFPFSYRLASPGSYLCILICFEVNIVVRLNQDLACVPFFEFPLYVLCLLLSLEAEVPHNT